MYLIVGKENLEAINYTAQLALESINELEELQKDEPSTSVTVSTETLEQLASGFLFLYQSILEAGIMPSNTSPKHKLFTLH